jgi:UDP-glucuronate 4-epimerase
MKILVTGAAGFIGFHTVKKMVSLGYNVVGIDNINNYYETTLKKDRLKILGISTAEIPENELLQSTSFTNFRFAKIDIRDFNTLLSLFINEKFDKVCHLAAQAGVRDSINNPNVYLENNIDGFLNVLECCRKGCKALIYASSSSVYGNAQTYPLKEDANTDGPENVYAVTKKVNELLAFTYKDLYQIESIGLRFFTVYGPWGRPDMAPMLFADAIYHQKPITVFNYGDLYRDFTYIDDIVNGIECVVKADNKKLKPVYNIGNSNPIKLSIFIKVLEDEIGIKAIQQLTGMQLGDVYKTFADISALKADFNYVPTTNLNTGIKEFVKWYCSYYHTNQ